MWPSPDPGRGGHGGPAADDRPTIDAVGAADRYLASLALEGVAVRVELHGGGWDRWDDVGSHRGHPVHQSPELPA